MQNLTQKKNARHLIFIVIFGVYDSNYEFPGLAHDYAVDHYESFEFNKLIIIADLSRTVFYFLFLCSWSSLSLS